MRYRTDNKCHLGHLSDTIMNIEKCIVVGSLIKLTHLYVIFRVLTLTFFSTMFLVYSLPGSQPWYVTAGIVSIPLWTILDDISATHGILREMLRFLLVIS